MKTPDDELPLFITSDPAQLAAFADFECMVSEGDEDRPPPSEPVTLKEAEQLLEEAVQASLRGAAPLWGALRHRIFGDLDKHTDEK